MAELADALDLGSSAARRAGSSPVPGTILSEQPKPDRPTFFVQPQETASLRDSLGQPAAATLVECGSDRQRALTSASAAIRGRLLYRRSFKVKYSCAPENRSRISRRNFALLPVNCTMRSITEP